MVPWEWFASLSVFPASILSLWKGFHFPSRPKTQVVLYILDNEDEAPRCATLCCEGVATLGQFRALLEKEPSCILWPFDFYDSKLKCRIAAEYEQSSPLELYDHVVTVIRSHGRQAMLNKRKNVELESMALTEPTTEEVIGSHGREAMVKKRRTVELQSMLLVEPTTVEEGIPHVSSVSVAPVSCDLISTPPYEEQDEHGETSQPCEEEDEHGETCPPYEEQEDEHGETSCPELDPKHKVFLSHSGVEKRFVGKLCKLLVARSYCPFFDQRPDSLPKGKKFASLIIEAAKKCLVAVVVLSEDYLSSKWPMIELAEFVRASKSGNKNLNLLPLFYKVTVDDLNDMSIKYKWMPKWMKLAGVDQRVDPEEWAEAVRELRCANGLVFHGFEKNGVMFHGFENKESYRDAIVDAIFGLTPPDLLYDTSKILGNTRICEILAKKFRQGLKTTASVLGLYGVGGLGKTTISKSLCNHFTKEFLGRVCYIEMREGIDALERQQMVMRKLLRLVEPLIQDICDASQGWVILKKRMKENPVFLVIDNVQPDEESIEEALKYSNVEYNPQSKIMVVSRSLDVVERVLGDCLACCEIPRLERKEAIGILLQQGGQKLEEISLSKNERAIVKACVEEAWFQDQDCIQTYMWHHNRCGYYHPLALKALGAYLQDRSKTCRVASWVTYLDEFRKLKGTRDSYDTLFNILGLQFIILDKLTQMIYLDIVLYGRSALKYPLLSNSPLKDMEIWLANIHDVSLVVVKQKIFYLCKSALLHIEGEKIIIHDLYKEYGKWAVKHVVNSEELGGVWCDDLDYSQYLLDKLFTPKPYTLYVPRELQSTPSGICWQELRRICLRRVSFYGFAMTRFQEWKNVVVLQITRCDHVTTLNLQGFTCLRHLELRNLWDLQTLILTEDESTFLEVVSQASCTRPKKCFLQPWLQYVVLEGLSSLELLQASFSPFTSLKYLEVVGCRKLREPPRVQHCSKLKRMKLNWYIEQKTLPNLDGLTSLRDLNIRGNGHFWHFRKDNLKQKLEGLSSLISLGALELRGIPVGDLNGLEKLTNVEYIQLGDLYQLEDLPPLESLASSSLHVLNVSLGRQPRSLEQLQGLISQKLERLAAQGERVPHCPAKICLVASPMCLSIDIKPLRDIYIPQLQRDLDTYAGGHKRRFHICRVHALANLLHKPAATTIRQLFHEERLKWARQEALQWQADPGDDLDELEVFKHLKQQAETSPLWAKAVSQSKFMKHVTTLVVSVAVQLPSMYTANRNPPFFHRYCIRWSIISIWGNDLSMRDFAMPQVFPNAPKRTRSWWPYLELKIDGADFPVGMKPAVIWQLQFDFVDLQQTSCKSKQRRRINPFQQVPSAPVADERLVKEYRGVRHRKDRKTQFIVTWKPSSFKKKVDFCAFKSKVEAALGADAVFHYYGRPDLLNFPETTPQILSRFPLLTELDGKSMIRFVQEKVKWLASKASELRPSTTA